MAEFITVMKEYHRLCDTYPGCCGCPFNGLDFCGKLAEMSGDKLNEFEQIVMTWTKEHPEPQYPTWEEWMEKEFDRSPKELIAKFSPCIFDKSLRNYCCDESTYAFYCDRCRRERIPAEVAKKLGIKPKE